MSDIDTQAMDMRMDAADLYREEIFTDRQVGTVRRLIPVKVDGTPDDKRPVSYIGQTQMLTPLGALPLSFEINATSLEEAIRLFGDAAQQAAERTIDELREMRREAASSIVLPEAGMGRGGIPGGGKIQFP